MSLLLRCQQQRCHHHFGPQVGDYLTVFEKNVGYLVQDVLFTRCACGEENGNRQSMSDAGRQSYHCGECARKFAVHYPGATPALSLFEIYLGGRMVQARRLLCAQCRCGKVLTPGEPGILIYS